MKAKAMVLASPGHMQIEEFELIAPRSDQILIKTGVTSVCASDPKMFSGRRPFNITRLSWAMNWQGRWQRSVRMPPGGTD